jgi:hemerythrin-like domain-containing protein
MNDNPQVPNAPSSLRYWQSEADSFQAVVSALDAALQTDVSDSDRWRKLAHIRFVTTMLQRFLDRLFAAEECDHLAELDRHPEWQHRVNELRGEHVVLRSGLSQAMSQLDRACGANAAACDEAFDKLCQMIKSIQQHMHKENELIQDCFNQEWGGESG